MCCGEAFPECRAADRLATRWQKKQTVPVRLHSLEEILNPQPCMSEVMQRLLGWIDRVDEASENQRPKPPFQTEAGGPIFPDHETLWWQTDVQKKKKQRTIIEV